MGSAIKGGTTSVSTVIRIIDNTTGLPEESVIHTTTGIDLWYRRDVDPGSTPLAKVSITEAALAALTTAWAEGGIEHIGDGYYRLDVPDAAFAGGAIGVQIGGTLTDMMVIGNYHPLVDYDPNDTVRMGLTALPSVVAGDAGGLPDDTDANGAVRIVDGTGARELNTNSGAVALVDLVTTLTTYTSNTPQSADNDTKISLIATKAEMDTAHGLLATEAKQDVSDALILKIPLSDGSNSWNATALAAIESEVDDALDASITQLTQGAPVAAPSIRTGLMLLYMLARNKVIVQTSGTDALELYADDGSTLIAKKLLTDATGDYTEAEMTTGA